ncbi:MAG TPA: ABC-three component system protein, partial [Flavisolibacter sp.]|nr:ABC-three component system protein [Flavisolibacter sp.]
PITPTDIYLEFGKLCYYTFKKDYEIPQAYYIVAPKGVGPSLQDLIDVPTDINTKLIAKWDDYCKDHITKKVEVALTDELRDYIEKFNFSIVKAKQPHELIGEHGTTTYHASRFGGGLLKYRQTIPKAVEEIDKRELEYTEQLLEVYSQELSKPIATKDELEKEDADFFEHFNHQRDCFYSAESLEKFSRENFPDANPLPFDEVKEDTYGIVENALFLNRKEGGLKRLTYSIQEVLRSSFNSSPLKDEIKEIDKKGICHYLANEKRVKWVK